jgi:hypothetical protein
VSASRISLFMSKVKLRKYQRFFINKFLAFHISSEEVENELIKKLDLEEGNLIEAGYTD